MQIRLWEYMKEDNLLDTIFFDIKTLDDWIKFPKLLHIVTMEDEVLGAFWLHGTVKGIRAYISMFFRKRFWKPKLTELVGKKCLKYIKENLNFPLLLAMCQSKNKMVIRYSLSLGFKKIGIIPRYLGNEDVILFYKEI